MAGGSPAGARRAVDDIGPDADLADESSNGE
jgi:hypothetical protein